MGEEMMTIGMVVGLDYRDAALSVHDLLQAWAEGDQPVVAAAAAGGG